MKILLILFFLLGLNTSFAVPQICTEQQKPHLVHPLENWDVISSSVANINASTSFSGPNLIYSLSYTPGRLSNRVSINPHTGEINIAAVGIDNFNVTVTATNACGTASGTFNVQIDAEQNTLLEQ